MPLPDGLMDETPIEYRRVKMSENDLEALRRGLQWPEDRAAYDRTARATNLTEIRMGNHVHNNNLGDIDLFAPAGFGLKGK